MEFCKFRANFIALTVLESALLPNSFEVSATFVVNEANPHAQNVAFQRMKQFLNNELNCIIIVQKSNPLLKTLSKVQNKIMVLPNDGPDWMLSCALLMKLNAICENKFSILEVEVSSSLGDNVSYFADLDRKEFIMEQLNELPVSERWWNSADTSINKFQKFNSWSALGLDWELTKGQDSASINKIIKFTPKVLKGGNNNK